MSDSDLEPPDREDSGAARLSARDSWVLLLVVAAIIAVLSFTMPRLSDAAVLSPQLLQHTDLTTVAGPWLGR